MHFLAEDTFANDAGLNLRWQFCTRRAFRQISHRQVTNHAKKRRYDTFLVLRLTIRQNPSA